MRSLKTNVESRGSDAISWSAETLAQKPLDSLDGRLGAALWNTISPPSSTRRLSNLRSQTLFSVH